MYDAVFAAATDRAGKARRLVPALRCVPPYFDHPGYIGALQRRIEQAVAAGQPPDHVVLTFHGLPERYVTDGDPYREHCQRTVEALTAAMRWQPSDYTVAYQSRFGPEKWLEPSTADILKGLSARGVVRPLIVAPGFTTDCLETLDELGNEGRDEFAEGGGDPAQYRICPCLNDQAEWIQTMVQLVTSPRNGLNSGPSCRQFDKIMTIGPRGSVRSMQRHGIQRRSIGSGPWPGSRRGRGLADLPSRDCLRRERGTRSREGCRVPG